MLSAPPLRTVRDGFPSYGSCLSKPIAAAINRLQGRNGVIIQVTFRMTQTAEAVFSVTVPVTSCIRIRSQLLSAERTASLLVFEQLQQCPVSFQDQPHFLRFPFLKVERPAFIVRRCFPVRAIPGKNAHNQRQKTNREYPHRKPQHKPQKLRWQEEPFPEPSVCAKML